MSRERIPVPAPSRAPSLGLLALLVGFTFLGAANRFDRKRDFIIEETNKIGAAYLRLDMLSGASIPLIMR
jgi:hypothetical protein